MNVIKIEAPPGSGIIAILQNGLSSGWTCINGSTLDGFGVSQILPTKNAENRADTIIVMDVENMHHQTREALVARLEELMIKTVILVSTV